METTSWNAEPAFEPAPPTFLAAACLPARAESVPLDLAALWGSLIRGECSIVGSGTAANRGFFVCLETREASSGSAPPARSLGILERILLGESQKELACDLRLGASTITVHCQRALSAFGVELRVSRVSVVLTMAAHAAHGFQFQPARVCLQSPGGRGRYRLSVELGSSASIECLSTNEWKIVEMVANGLPHTEIAQVRGTCARTVANQLGSVFRKLNVSGRGELLAKLVRDAALQNLRCSG